MAERRRLTDSERARLGGLARARKAGPEGMALMGHKGGMATKDRMGYEHFVRMSMRSHGVDVEVGREAAK